MTDLQTYLYECFVTTLENGQQVLFQVFRDPETFACVHAQMAFKTPSTGTWGNPYQLEKR
jgi:hypothetical protein